MWIHNQSRFYSCSKQNKEEEGHLISSHTIYSATSCGKRIAWQTPRPRQPLKVFSPGWIQRRRTHTPANTFDRAAFTYRSHSVQYSCFLRRNSLGYGDMQRVDQHLVEMIKNQKKKMRFKLKVLVQSFNCWLLHPSNYFQGGGSNNRVTKITMF